MQELHYQLSQIFWQTESRFEIHYPNLSREQSQNYPRAVQKLGYII